MQLFDCRDGVSIGHGGTKTIVSISEDIVVAIPNSTDGESLISIWPRIIDDEIAFSSLLTDIGIPVLKWHKCNVKLHDGRILTSITTNSFSSYIKDNIYIIDTKCKKSTTWIKDKCCLIPEGIDSHNLELWKKITLPLFNDIKLLAKHNIRLSGDALNLAIVGKDSILHSGGDLPYEFRLFAFDLSSKSSALNLNQRHPVSYETSSWMLHRVLMFSIWDGLTPNSFVLGNKETQLHESLYDYHKKQLDFYDDHIKNKNRSDNNLCVIS